MIIAIIVLLLTVLELVFLTVPLFKNDFSYDRKIKDIESSIGTIQLKRKNLDELVSNSQLVADYLALSRKVVPDTDEVPFLLSQAQQICLENGVKVVSIQYNLGSKTSKSEDVVKYAVGMNVTIKSSYSQLIAVIRDMEKARRLMAINSIKISSSSKDEIDTYQSSISLEGYYLPVSNADAEKIEANALDKAWSRIKKALEVVRQTREYSSEIQYQTEDIVSGT